MTLKKCSNCGELKPTTEYKRWVGQCKDCLRSYKRKWVAENNAAYRADQRRRRLHRLYGMSVEDYDSLLESQGGVCAICGVEPANTRLSVDHHHGTGAVRGLLCQNCNRAIGLLGDDPNTLLKAARYLLDSITDVRPSGGIRKTTN